MGEPKVGLALGSGGARGFAHIGVLKMLEKASITVDYIAGSSMGALVGALYGAGYDPGILEKMAIQFRRKFYLDFTVPKMGFIKGEKAKQLIQMLVNNKKFEDLNPEVSVVATDLMKGNKTIFKKGDIAQAVRASIAIPGIVVPESINGKLYVDGGVIDRVPVAVVKEMGADIIVAVDVSFFNDKPEITSIYDVIIQSMDIMEKEMVRYREVEADIMIQPILKYINGTEFTNVEDIIQQGERAAEKIIVPLQERIQIWKENNHEG